MKYKLNQNHLLSLYSRLLKNTVGLNSMNMLCQGSRRVEESDLLRDRTHPNQDLGQRRPSRPPPRTFNTRQYKQTVAQCPLCVDPMDVRVCDLRSLSLTLSSRARTRPQPQPEKERKRNFSFPSARSFIQKRAKISFVPVPFGMAKGQNPSAAKKSRQEPAAAAKSKGIARPPARLRWPLSQQKRRPATAPLFKNTADAFWNRFVPNFR